MTATVDPPNPDQSADHKQLRLDVVRLGASAQFALDLAYREHLNQPQTAVGRSLTEPVISKLTSRALQDLAHIIIGTVPPILAVPAA